MAGNTYARKCRLYSIQTSIFLSESNGFTIGKYGKIYRTTDSGQNWDRYTFYDDIKQLQFVSTSLAFVASGKDVYTTEDSGQTWKYLSTFEKRIVSLKFINENTGYLITLSSVYKTTDGGVTWEEKNNGITTNFQDNLLCIDFADENTGIISGGSYEDTVTYKTSDGGETWTSIYEDDYSISTFDFIDKERHRIS
ncbi:YCF48-related protein [Galbibacter sp. PAP.153]|uniref:WD40/YVTN/BNR-like repeat-containing protein n=1 Tax=Galbibacter sp. PAP.153 TaxID=3104623 RepID=UPI00300A9FAF